MSKKSARIAAMIESYRGHALDAHYLGYFECFNQKLFYEAHDVLEELWLPERRTAKDHFYKGLIQLAGAFVHLQKNRLGPAGALFKLARNNLMQYPSPYEHLDISGVLALIEDWLRELEKSSENPLHTKEAPKLSVG